MIVPKSVINKIHRVEFSLYEPASTTVLWAYPVGQSYDYRLFLAGQWTSVSDGGDASLLELIQRAELAIKAAVAATEGAETVNAALTGNVLTITDREGNTTSLDLSEIGGGYEPPAGGIPKTDLASDVQTSLGKADTAIQDISGKADKPLVIVIGDGDTEVPSGTYASITAAIAEGREVVVIYDDSGEYARYNLTYDSTEIGEGYSFNFNYGDCSYIVRVYDDDTIEFNYIILSNANHTHGNILNDGTITSDTTVANGDKLVITDASDNNKVNRANIAFDGSTTTKALTPKGTWGTFYQKPANGIPASDLASDVQTSLGKADTALQSFTESDPTVPSWAKQSTKPSYSYSEITDKPTLATVATSGSYNDLSDKPTIPELPSNTAYLSPDSGDGIVPDDGIKAVTVTSAAAMTINPDVVTVIDGAVGTAAITLQVPQDNLAHVWDILMTTDSSVAITFAMSNSETILYPSGFSVGASKAVEVSVIGVGETYYLRYGEFA